MTTPANPYVGLRPFEDHEAELFFGRREQTVELMERLHAGHFLAVVGSSGCGKSSLVRAGLIPALRGGFLVAERDRWQVAATTPGDGPWTALAAALAPVAGVAAESLRTQLAQDPLATVLERVVPGLFERRRGASTGRGFSPRRTMGRRGCGNQPEDLQRVIRASTHICLTPDFRHQHLGELPDEAVRRAAVCEASQRRRGDRTKAGKGEQRAPAGGGSATP